MPPRQQQSDQHVDRACLPTLTAQPVCGVQLDYARPDTRRPRRSGGDHPHDFRTTTPEPDLIGAQVIGCGD
jgi:hypothetical protein